MSEQNNTNGKVEPVEYRTIDKYPGYRFGSDGSLWSCKLTGPQGKRKSACGSSWRRLKVDVDSHGYTRITVYVRGNIHRPLLHRLIARLFVANPAKKPHVNHLDGDKRNSAASNLEWVTHAENIRHSFDVLGRKGTAHVGINNGRAKLNEADVRTIRRQFASGVSRSMLRREFKVSPTLIRKIISRELWTHIEEAPGVKFTEKD